MQLGAAALLIGLAAGSTSEPMTFRQVVRVSGPQVRLGDVADLSPLPAALRPAASRLVVAAAPARRATTISSRQLAARAASLMPVLVRWTAAVADGSVEVRRSAAGPLRSEPARTCFLALRPLAVGETPLRTDFETALCDRAENAFAYDRDAGVLRMARAVGNGEPIAAVSPNAFAGARPGAQVRLHARVGPVVVERDVEVLRAARAGAWTVMKAADGQSFAAPLAVAAQ